MPQTARSTHEDSPSDAEELRRVRSGYFLRPLKGKQPEAVHTPNLDSPHTPHRYELRSTSSSVSRASSSGSPRVFDSPSPAGTPLTPPSNPGKTFTRTSKIEDSKDSHFVDRLLASSTPDNTASSSLARGNLEQDAQRRQHSPVNGSPTQQKYERNQKHKGGASIERLAARTRDSSNAASRRRQKLADVPVDDVSPQPGPSHRPSSEIDNDTDMTDAEEHGSSEAPQPPAETLRKYVAKDAPESTTTGITPSDESNKEDAASQSPLENESTQSMRRKISKKPTESLLKEQSGTQARPKISSDRLSNEGNSPNPPAQAASSSKRRTRKSTQPTKGSDPSPPPQASSSSMQRRRVSSPPPASSRQVEVLPADTIAESQVLPTTNSPSNDEEREEEPAATTTGDLHPTIEEENTPNPDPDTIVVAQVDLGAQIPVLERYDEIVKTENALKVAILDAIFHKTRADLVSKHYIKANLYPRTVLQYLKPKSPLLKYNPSEGFIYIFTSEDYPGHVKIGVTTRDPGIRRKEWEKCGFTCIYVDDPEDKRFWNCRLVEKIVHTVLYNERRKFQCKKCPAKHYFNPEHPGASHGEWFKVSGDEALHVVKEWRNWAITGQPYTRLGVLREPWRVRCEAVRRGPAGVDSLLVVDATMKADYFKHSFDEGLRILAPLVWVAMLVPSYTWIPVYIFFQFGLGVTGLGVCFFSALAFITLLYNYC